MIYNEIFIKLLSSTIILNSSWAVPSITNEKRVKTESTLNKHKDASKTSWKNGTIMQNFHEYFKDSL